MTRRWIFAGVGVVGLWAVSGFATAGGLIEVLSIEHSDQQSKVVVLDIPFFTLFKMEKKEPDAQTVQVLDIPLITVLRHDRSAGEKVESEFLTFPIFGSVFRHKRDGEKYHTQVLFFINHRRPPGYD